MSNEKKTGRAMALKFESTLKHYPIERLNTSVGIVSWGERNDYAQFLVGLKEDSSIHGGIIEQKTTFIGGGGLKVEGDEQYVLDNYDGAFSLDEIQAMMVMDNEIFNGFACIWRENEDGNYVAEPVDFELLRTTEDGTVYGVSDNWLDKRITPKYYRSLDYHTDELLIDAFGVNYQFLHTLEEDAFIMVCIQRPKQRMIGEKVTSNYYPTPSYSGAIKSIVALDNMNRYTMNETANGFKGGTHIAMHNGIPDTDEEAQKAVNDIKRPLTDIDNSGGIVVTFDEGGDSKTEINGINGNDLDKRYESAKIISRDEILVAHQVISPTLFGIGSSNMFGSGDEMRIAYDLFQKNYARRRQKKIANALTWALSELNDFSGEIQYNTYVLFDEKKEDEVVENTVTQFRMSSAKEQEEQILGLFSNCGRERSKVRFKSNFASPLSDFQKAVLTMMKEGQDFDSMVKALELSESRVYGIIISLSDLGLIKDLELTDRGKELVLDEKDIEIVFSYEKKHNAPDLVKGGRSRDFCRAMMALNRVYTRDEINSISDQVGIDVWLYRGGWYHNPKLNINTPSCRHEWRQHSILNF